MGGGAFNHMTPAERGGASLHNPITYVTILSMGELTAPPTFRENAIRPTVVLEESI